MLRLALFTALSLSILAATSPAWAFNPECIEAISPVEHPELHSDGAKPIVLFSDDGTPTASFAHTIYHVKAGDRLQFDSNTIFDIQGVFGHGATTMVFDIGGGKALRVPFSPAVIRDPGLPMATLEDFIDSNRELAMAGVPVVRVDMKRSRRGQFAVVDAFRSIATLDDYMQGMNKWKNLGLSKKQEDAAMEALVEFATQFWKVKQIGDFLPGQLGFDGKNWMLLDYGWSTSYIADFAEKAHPFKSYEVETDYGMAMVHLLPKKLQKRVDEAILELRRKAEKKGALSVRPKAAASDKEVDFLLHAPYRSPLPDGTELYANWPATYETLYEEIHPEQEYLYKEYAKRIPIPFKIRRWIQDKGTFSLYEVELESGKPGYLALKNKFKPRYGHVKEKAPKFVKDGLVREEFKSIEKDTPVLSKGFDFVLFGTP